MTQATKSLRNINRATLLGDVATEPEIKRFEGGARLATFRLRTCDRIQDDRNGMWKTLQEWHNIVAWNEVCDQVDGKVHKGGDLFVEGTIRTKRYRDKSGAEKFITHIMATAVRPFGKGTYKSSRPAGRAALEAQDEEEGWL